MLRSMGSGGKEPTACQRGQSGFRHCQPVWAGRLLATPPGNRSMARGTRFGGKRTPKRGKRTPKRGKRFRSSLSRLFANHLLSEGSRVNQSPDRSDDRRCQFSTGRVDRAVPIFNRTLRPDRCTRTTLFETKGPGGPKGGRGRAFRTLPDPGQARHVTARPAPDPGKAPGRKAPPGPGGGPARPRRRPARVGGDPGQRPLSFVWAPSAPWHPFGGFL